MRPVFNRNRQLASPRLTRSWVVRHLQPSPQICKRFTSDNCSCLGNRTPLNCLVFYSRHRIISAPDYAATVYDDWEYGWAQLLSHSWSWSNPPFHRFAWRAWGIKERAKDLYPPPLLTIGAHRMKFTLLSASIISALALLPSTYAWGQDGAFSPPRLSRKRIH